MCHRLYLDIVYKGSQVATLLAHRTQCTPIGNTEYPAGYCRLATKLACVGPHHKHHIVDNFLHQCRVRDHTSNISVKARLIAAIQLGKSLPIASSNRCQQLAFAVRQPPSPLDSLLQTCNSRIRSPASRSSWSPGKPQRFNAGTPPARLPHIEPSVVSRQLTVHESDPRNGPLDGWIGHNCRAAGLRAWKR